MEDFEDEAQEVRRKISRAISFFRDSANEREIIEPWNFESGIRNPTGIYADRNVHAFFRGFNNFLNGIYLLGDAETVLEEQFFIGVRAINDDERREFGYRLNRAWSKYGRLSSGDVDRSAEFLVRNNCLKWFLCGYGSQDIEEVAFSTVPIETLQ